MSFLNLTTNDYFQVGVTNRNCIRVLPLSEKFSTQKFVIGDDSGIINCLEFAKQELSVKFKTPSFGKEITRVELSGSNYMNRDRISAAGGSYIRCFSNKGKEFFKFDTNSTEAIRGLGVEETYLWTAGEHLLNEYESQKDSIIDKNYYLSADKINDLFIHCLTVPNIYHQILACQDNSIKILSSGKELTKFDTKAPVNCLAPHTKDVKLPISKQVLEKSMVLGLGNGSIMSIGLNIDNPVLLWSLKASNANEANISNAGVLLIHSCDFTKNGLNDLLIARDDASLELYSMNVNGEMEMQYRQIFKDAVTGLDCGIISRVNMNEFVVSTYSGRVLGITENEEERKGVVTGGDSKKKKENTKEMEMKIKTLRTEIDKLKKNIDDINGLDNTESGLSTNANSFKINYKYVKNSDDASYSVHLDSQYPINFILLQTNINIELLENDNNNSILSINPTLENDTNTLLATYRLIETNISKFEIKFRTLEGKSGFLTCFVVPNVSPKTSQVFKVPIKSLSLHEKTNENIDLSTLPLNIITFTGPFTKNDIHLWVSNILPEFPKLADEDTIEFIYKSTFVGSILYGKIKANEAIFKSDSISAITIIKETISHEASSRSINININWDLNDESVERILNLLSPKYDFHNKIAQQFQMIPALKELMIQEGNSSFLSPEYQEILENEAEITKLYMQQPKKLLYLRGIIADLYADRATFKGISNINQKIQGLIKALNNFNVTAILEIFLKEK